ncbi:MAG: site-specific integrase [Polyangiaceae bacterium]|nr:site-specific integrase [Polyangiaceae bacterium]
MTTLALEPILGHEGTSLSTELVDRAADYARVSKATSTVVTYGYAWRGFVRWCRTRGVAALPADPTTVATYLADEAGRLKVATLELRIVSIAEAHRLAGLDSPTKDPRVVAVLKGVRRTHGKARTKKKPLSVLDLKSVLSTLGDDLQGRRDAAMLLLTYGAALRRSEVVGLDVGDIEFHPDGLIVNVRRSKTDQEGTGHRVGVGYGSSPETCPVVALRKWLAATGLTNGPLFRAIDRHGKIRRGRLRPRAVARIIQNLGDRVGLDPKKLGGHSLRAGFATAAARAGLSEREIARTTRHKSMAVLRGYIHEGEMFAAESTRRIGL